MTDEKRMLKPAPGEFTVECPHCHARVSETMCDAETCKKCYNYVVNHYLGLRRF